MRVVYLDTETSGFQPGQICQLSYVMAEDGKLVYRFNQYFSVNFIHPDAARVTGLSVGILNTLSQGTIFADVADIVSTDLSGKLVVGHNIGFDEKFVSVEMARLGKSFFFDKTFDTMYKLTNTLKIPSRNKNYTYKNPKLAEAIKFFNIPESYITGLTAQVFGQDDRCAHDARYDCIATYLVCEEAKKARIFDVSLTKM